MVKIRTAGAYEMVAANYTATYRDNGEEIGFRIVLRSDRKILKRTRWYTNSLGERVAARSGAYQAWLTVKEEKYAEARADGTLPALLDRIMARRGLTPDTEGIKPREQTEKPPAPEFSSLREKIEWERGEREKRYREFAELHAEAVRAGARAAEECVPTPMHVVEHVDPLDEDSPALSYPPVTGGPCGFAWVRLSRGNTSFAHWARKHAGFKSSDYQGTYLWVTDYGQSMERKAAFARAYAKVLTDAGIGAYGASRMD